MSIPLTDRELEAFDKLDKAGQERILSLLKEDACEAARGSLLDYCVYVPLPEVPEGAKPAKHHRLLIDVLEKVERGEIKNLLVFEPPGCAKSGRRVPWRPIGLLNVVRPPGP